MKHLLGYVHLEDPTGQCVELVNGARTLALMRAAWADPTGTDGCRVHPSWQLAAGERVWDGNSCWAFDSGQYGAASSRWDDPGGDQDLNPWEDSDNPATFEVAGFLPDAPGRGLGIQIEPPVSSRVMSADRIEPLEFLITGTVMAGTERGEQAWLQWASGVLTDPYSYRSGWLATVFPRCADQSDWASVSDPLDLPADPSGEPTYTTWDDPSPNLLTEWTDPTPYPTDSGLWQLFDVKFQSIDELSDQPLFPHCVGRRYAIRFTVGRHWVYDRPRTLATLGGSGNWSASETYRNPLTVGTQDPEDDNYLGPPGLPVPRSPRPNPGLRGGRSRWSLPDSCLRVAALTPPRPVTLYDDLVVTVTNPSVTTTVHNARVRLWEAYVGYPHPNTQIGDEFYRDREPEAELRIIELQPGETITYDGRTKRLTLTTSTQVYNVVPGRVESPAGARVELPALSCNRRYWACAELSADSGSYGDLDLEVSVAGAQRMIPT